MVLTKNIMNKLMLILFWVSNNVLCHFDSKAKRRQKGSFIKRGDALYYDCLMSMEVKDVQDEE